MNRITIQADQGQVTIDKNIYGHFAEHLGRCIYEGIWVGEHSPIPNTHGIRNDVVAALRQIKVPVLRWPGGCFADEYHWQDGIGPRPNRPSIVNTHWGGVTENNHFGTHEFLDLCEQIEAEPYICGNVGSGTVREMQQWVEYITHDGQSPMADLRRQNGRDVPWKLRYFGVGNENWGCGGSMRPEYYADVYRRYQTYVRDFGDNHIFKIACGPNSDDYRWTDVMMREAGRFMHGLSLHYYTVPGTWDQKGSAIDFDEEAWHTTLQRALHMDELVSRTSTIMDAYDPARRVALIVDEWGTWYDVEPGTNPGFLYQQNTLRDALVAAMHLNIFNNHSQRVRMANIAQTINVLQAMILTDGPRMLTTPTYHVFDMYKHHQNATLLPCVIDCDTYTVSNGQSIPRLNVSASRSASGTLHLTICHTDPHHETEVHCSIRGATPQRVSATVLTAPIMNAHNTFDQPDDVTPTTFDGTAISGNDITIKLPPMSVVALSLSLTPQ